MLLCNIYRKTLEKLTNKRYNKKNRNRITKIGGKNGYKR